MALFGWPDCPAAVRDQVEGLVESVRLLLGQALAGLYLHGSLACGCFNPERSDLDVLVLTTRPVARGAKLGLVKAFLRRSQAPAPLEISVVARQDLTPWQHPTPYQLHFSEAWRERLRAEATSLAWLAWPDGAQGTDPDLATHVTMARARGIALLGPPPAQALPDVPPADYLAAILRDSEAALTQPLANSVSTVLNLCRIAWYLRAQVLSSKEEAGVWAQETVRPAHQPLVRQALAAYRGAEAPAAWDADAIRRFGHQVLAAAASGHGGQGASGERQLPLGQDR